MARDKELAQHLNRHHRLASGSVPPAVNRTWLHHRFHVEMGSDADHVHADYEAEGAVLLSEGDQASDRREQAHWRTLASLADQGVPKPTMPAATPTRRSGVYEDYSELGE